jgi:hypothetical protein
VGKYEGSVYMPFFVQPRRLLCMCSTPFSRNFRKMAFASLNRVMGRNRSKIRVFSLIPMKRSSPSGMGSPSLIFFSRIPFSRR